MVVVRAQRRARGELLAALIALASWRSRWTSISARACSAATGAASPRRCAARPRARTRDHDGRARLGAAEYYLPGLHNLRRGTSVLVQRDRRDRLRAAAGLGRAARRRRAFVCAARTDVNGLIVYRFVSAGRGRSREATLRRHVITLAHPEVLVPAIPAFPHGRAECKPSRRAKRFSFPHGSIDGRGSQRGPGWRWSSPASICSSYKTRRAGGGASCRRT